MTFGSCYISPGSISSIMFLLFVPLNDGNGRGAPIEAWGRGTPVVVAMVLEALLLWWGWLMVNLWLWLLSWLLIIIIVVVVLVVVALTIVLLLVLVLAMGLLLWTGTRIKVTPVIVMMVLLGENDAHCHSQDYLMRKFNGDVSEC